MFDFDNLGLKAMVKVPAFFVALWVAELFYKFHSFIKEALAFSATYVVLHVLIAGVVMVFRGKELESV